MRKMMILGLALMLVASAAYADKPTKKIKPVPVSKPDTVKVTVLPASGKNQFRLDVHVTNADSVAGLPVPLRVSAEKAKLFYDSVSYAGGRLDYFQLKTDNPDSAEQTLLLGLIADLSGSKPPLAPGRGKAMTIFYTADKPIKAEDIRVEGVVIPPANKLEFNVYRDGEVASVIPTLVVEVGKPDNEKKRGSLGKGKK
jgi:hypothetical protein